MTREPLMQMAFDERSDLLAYLSTLSAEDWNAASLCRGWTVKDVVAHVISYEELTAWGVLARIARGYFLRANDIGVREYASLSPGELIDFLGRHLEPRGLTAGFGGMIALVDGTVHHQDIRRALDHPRVIPVDRLARILPLVPSNPRLGAGRRIRGLRLRATDVEWEHGGGPIVSGTGEALLLAMTGRTAVLGELTGPGVAMLADRLVTTA